ncbi:universal stress protein [Mycolicibacter heraklionensis]|nr:universal stress protein [Mycolicibacter heraklionensis]
MYGPHCSAPRVVVGLDASRAAMQAATWAVDEAVDRDIPLWLLYAIDEAGGPHDAAAEVATAEKTVRSAISAIESLGKPVRAEAEIVRRHPVPALVEASRSAALVCVGSIGFEHAAHGRIGSTGSAVVASAHCPVAVVPRTRHLGSRGTGLVLAVVDGSSASDRVLELSVAEARLRDAPLRVFIVRRPHRSRPGDTLSPLDQRVVADVERRVANWRSKQPALDIDWVSDHNGLLNYLEHLQRNATPIQLIVVDPRRPGPVDVLLGAAARAPLEAAGCTVMTCDRTGWL